MTSTANPAARFPEVQFRLATENDVEALVRVINAAFTVERSVFDGDRVDVIGVRKYMSSGKFLLAESAGELAGCIYVELRGARGYIGLLSVVPERQGTGLGRKLMNAAEDYFHEARCQAVDLRVISQRTPLPAFYRHLGYAETATAPFAETAKPKIPGHYIIMSKSLA